MHIIVDQQIYDPGHASNPPAYYKVLALYAEKDGKGDGPKAGRSCL